MTYINFISRILLGLIFLVAAIGKSRNHDRFAKTIRRIGIHSGLVQVIAWLIIFYEALLGIVFVLDIFPQIAISMALFLLALFAGVSIKVERLRQKIRCNCFSQAGALLGKQTLVRVILLLLLVGTYYLSTHFVDSAWWPTNFGTAISLYSLVIGAAVLIRWLLASKTLAALMYPTRCATSLWKS